MTPERVRLMRKVRRLLKAGRNARDIQKMTSCTFNQIAVQRMLLAISEGNRAGEAAALSRHRLRGGGGWKGTAEEIGDLVDILASRATKRDLRFAFVGAD